MESKIEKAYESLKTMKLFSSDYNSFKSLFNTALKEKGSNEKLAIEYLLMVVYRLLNSDGERFNELIKKSNKKKELLNWLDESLKRVGG